MPRARYDKIGRHHTTISTVGQTTRVRLYDTVVFSLLRVSPGLKIVTIDCDDWHTQVTYRRIRQAWNSLVGEFPYEIRLGRRVVRVYRVGQADPVLAASLDNPVSLRVTDEDIVHLDNHPPELVLGEWEPDQTTLPSQPPKTDLFS